MTKSKVLSVVLAGALVASMGAIAASAANAATDSFGVIGTVNGNWDTDTVMTDEDGDGVFTCQITVEAGEYEWKVRTNADWADSWGDPDDDGYTYNSQDNCDLVAETAGTYEFSIDTNGDEQEWACAVTAVEAPVTEESSETEAPSTEESSETDAPATGDATSAYALVGVVVAALGVAVVMTKKASVK